jgi:hypothetical protein
MVLNLFYEEPENDRWITFDRYPRRILRRLLRGKPRPGGQTRVFLNLCQGLDKIGVAYRVNDYAHIQRHPTELACIIGKPFVLDKIQWKNPILFGAAVFSHPTDDPDLFQRLNIQKVLVPGPWMLAMCQPYWGKKVLSWPVGIDTKLWCPPNDAGKKHDVLIYNKILWNKETSELDLAGPIRRFLEKSGFNVIELKYGHYQEIDFHDALSKCKAMVFLCEHETQGIAYQQALSCGVPIFAWDKKGAWQDPAYYPHKVNFSPVSSVPYWDRRCGEKFVDFQDFLAGFDHFWANACAGIYRPRDFILENLTLEQSARMYVNIAEQCTKTAVSDNQ